MSNKKSATSRVLDISDFRSITSLMSDTENWFYDVGESQEIFERMLDDARVGSLVELRKDKVKLLNGSFTDSGDKAVDEAVKNYLDFNTFFNLNNILLNAVPFGIAITEVIWKRDSNGILYPTSFVPIPRTAVNFPFTGNKISYNTPVLTCKNIPLNDPNKFLIHRNDTGNGDRWGTPVLRRAYWAWRFKTIGFDAWVFAAKKIGVPTILAIFETQNETEAKTRARDLTEALQEWGSGSSGALGNVKDLKIVDSNIKDFNTLVETCNAELAYAITGQSLGTNEAQYGTRAQSETHIQILGDVIINDAYLLQQTCQNLVNAFVRLNFPGRKVPLYDIDSTDIAGWEIIREAIDRGIAVSKSALYDKIKLPKPKDESDSFVKAPETNFDFSDPFFN